VNSYILWCQCNPQEKRRHLAYRKDLICELVREHLTTRDVVRRGRPSAAIASAERLTIDSIAYTHWMTTKSRRTVLCVQTENKASGNALALFVTRAHHSLGCALVHVSNVIIHWRITKCKCNCKCKFCCDMWTPLVYVQTHLGGLDCTV
jgi:hypothetical protein